MHEPSYHSEASFSPSLLVVISSNVFVLGEGSDDSCYTLQDTHSCSDLENKQRIVGNSPSPLILLWFGDTLSDSSVGCVSSLYTVLLSSKTGSRGLNINLSPRDWCNCGLVTPTNYIPVYSHTRWTLLKI